MNETEKKKAYIKNFFEFSRTSDVTDENYTIPTIIFMDSEEIEEFKESWKDLYGKEIDKNYKIIAFVTLRQLEFFLFNKEEIESYLSKGKEVNYDYGVLSSDKESVLPIETDDDSPEIRYKYSTAKRVKIIKECSIYGVGTDPIGKKMLLLKRIADPNPIKEESSDVGKNVSDIID